MTRARDIAGGTIFTSSDNTKLDGIATGATAYVHPTGAGNQHVPAAGATGQLLQYASAGTAAWATVTSGLEVVFPSNWSNPTNTYTTSGTWSKGSLSDDAYVWVYLLGGGGGGGAAVSGASYRSNGAAGGTAIHIYGKAGVLHGGTYAIGAGGAGQSSTHHPSGGGATTFTLTDTNGGTVFNTSSQSGRFIATKGAKDTVDLASFNDFVAFANGGASFTFTDVMPTGVVGLFTNAGMTISSYQELGRPFHTIFSGGGGGGQTGSGTAVGNHSEFAGDGGDGSTNSAAAQGAARGGGGAGSKQGLATGGNGAEGNMRVYHV